MSTSMTVICIIAALLLLAIIVAAFQSHKNFDEMAAKKYPITPDMDETAVEIVGWQRKAYKDGWSAGVEYQEEEQRLKEQAEAAKWDSWEER